MKIIVNMKSFQFAKDSEMHCRGKRGVEHSATSFSYSQRSQCYNEKSLGHALRSRGCKPCL